MTGIVVAGISIGQLAGPPVISRLIAAYDWRQTCIILGSIVLVFVVIATQFMRRDPAQKGLLPYGGNEAKQQEGKSGTIDFSFKEAVRTTQFWLAFFTLICFGYCLF